MKSKNWDKPMVKPSVWCDMFTEYHGLPENWKWPEIYEFMGLGKEYKWSPKDFEEKYISFCKIMSSPLGQALM